MPALKLLVYRAPANQAQIRIAMGVALALFLVFVPALFLVKMPLPRVDAFFPIVEATMVMASAITATLLFAQGWVMAARPLRVLAAGYLLTGLLVMARALTFSGLFTPQGLLGAKFDSTIWLYLAAHTALPAAVIAYSLFGRALGRWQPLPSPSRALVFGCYLAVPIAGAVILTAVATAGANWLPALTVSPTQWEPTIYVVVSPVLILTIAAMAMLWLEMRAVLDLWLLLVLWGSFLETILLVLASGRYTMGWYMGNGMGLLSSLFVLFSLLAETSRLYAQSVQQLVAHVREHENRFLIRDVIAASIAHELRQPLSVILLDAHVARKTPPSEIEELAQLLDEITAASLRANGIIDSTRAIFGRHSREKRPTDIAALLHSSVALIANSARAQNVSIDVGVEGQPKHVNLNWLQMQQVVLNLLQNAIDALSQVGGRRRTLTVRCIPGPKTVTISVEDNGPGVAPADRERIFDAFFTTRRDGTGMGLSIARTVVEAHHGWIGVEDRAPWGTAFVIRLPYDGDGGEKTSTGAVKLSREASVPSLH
ncbi:MAG TPA: ATP-binding protein [Rhizomicrobium sp.]|nr:ATP-binding protein [Rhizomicrobium sp.]